MPIVDLQRRLHESGRIRIGVTAPTGKGKGRRPQRLTTFRMTGQDRRALDRIAKLYGGAVEAWKDAPVGDQWQVITEVAEMRVAVPPERMALSQSMELWSGGGCVRRCDGVRQANDDPCVCAALDGEDPAPRCSRHTRLSLMLADLATTGLWRLDTQGFYASEELAGAFELAQMLAAATGRALLPGWLRLEQREIRRPGEQVKRFAVPVLDLEMDTAALLGPSRVAPALPPTVDVNGELPPEGLTPIPPAPASSLAKELARVEEPKTPQKRRNAAAPLGKTGLKPHTAAQRQALTEPAARPKATPPQMRKLFALLRELRIEDRDDQLDWANQYLERTIVSASELTDAEASKLIDAAGAKQASPGETGPAETTPALESGTPPPARPEAATSHGASGPAAPAQLDPDRVDILSWLRGEAQVSDDWLHAKLTELGVPEVPQKITRAVITTLTDEQATQLGGALNSEIDSRNSEVRDDVGSD
jgi:Recombination directionality factor-like